MDHVSFNQIYHTYTSVVEDVIKQGFKKYILVLANIEDQIILSMHSQNKYSYNMTFIDLAEIRSGKRCSKDGSENRVYM